MADYPPQSGPLPDDALRVVARVNATCAVRAHRQELGEPLRDIETNEVVPADLEHMGWWAV